MKKIVLVMLFFPLLSVAQKEANIWYFGNKAGLDFNSGSPVVLTDGAMSTNEGCASVSDANGDLLFYTNGMIVYNKNHSTMLNGTGLLGTENSTQSAAIVKKPGSNTLYYIFTTDQIHGASAPQGLRYTEVDMSLDGGLGGITANKNILIEIAANEKVCIVAHQNNIDFWIVAKKDESDTYHSYLLTAGGLTTSPVINNIGTAINLTNGYLKASLDGSKVVGVYNLGPIAYTSYPSHVVEVFDFDNSTGIFSNYISLTDPSSFSDFYGAEFSADGQVLYVSALDRNFIYQYNLSLGTQAAINNSRIGLSVTGPSALQIAPNGKIYACQATTANTLGVINAPGVVGLGCDFDSVSVAFPLGIYPDLGLPNFVNSYVKNPEFNSAYYCFGDATQFFSNIQSYTSLSWDFGDPASGINNTSTLTNPNHLYSKSGDFTVTLSVTNGGSTYVVTDTITIKPELSFSSDTVICAGEVLLLDVTSDNATYLWQDGSTASSFLVSEAGTYSVEIILGSCKVTDSIEVVYNPVPSASVDFSDTICEGGEWTYAPIVTTGVAPYTLIWSDGIDTTAISGNQMEIAGTNPGSYVLLSIKDADGCIGTVSGSANFLWYPNLSADFSFTPEIAFIDSTVIDLTNLSVGHTVSNWSFGDGDTLIDNVINFSHIYEQPGDYVISLSVTNEYGCISIKNNRVQIFPHEYYVPNAFTPNADGLNDLFNINTTKVNGFEMEIRNRWGDIVYATSDVLEPWDGTENGIELEGGVYSYIILVIDPLDKLHKHVGHVMLVR